MYGGFLVTRPHGRRSHQELRCAAVVLIPIVCMLGRSFFGSNQTRCMLPRAKRSYTEFRTCIEHRTQLILFRISFIPMKGCSTAPEHYRAPAPSSTSRFFLRCRLPPCRAAPPAFLLRSCVRRPSRHRRHPIAAVAIAAAVVTVAPPANLCFLPSADASVGGPRLHIYRCKHLARHRVPLQLLLFLLLLLLLLLLLQQSPYGRSGCGSRGRCVPRAPARFYPT